MIYPSTSSAKRNIPQRAASKVEGPQELRQAVHLIVMFAVRNGGGLALEGREPGGLSWASICWWLRGLATTYTEQSSSGIERPRRLNSRARSLPFRTLVSVFVPIPG
jgi:hypothetical protein